MSSSITLKNAVVCSLAAAVSIASQGAFAHTRLQTPSIADNSTVYNNTVISHGCHNATTLTNSTAVIAHELVFPDGSDSIVSDLWQNGGAGIGTQAAPLARTPIDVNSDGAPDTVDDHLANWGNIPQAIQSDDVFDKNSLVEKYDALGNVVGYSYTGGNMAGTLYGLVPFRTSGVLFQPDSCAKTVTFETWGAEICSYVKKNQLADTNVNMWTPFVGSQYDGGATATTPYLHGFNSPATLKITRNLTTNPLPAGCPHSTAYPTVNGQVVPTDQVGYDIRVTPSAAQINRDAPLMDTKGKQVWPKK